jgi:hypothetical protein
MNTSEETERNLHPESSSVDLDNNLLMQGMSINHMLHKQVSS